VANGNFLIGELTLFKDAKKSQVDKHRILYQINHLGKKSEKSSETKAEKLTKSTSSEATVSSTTEKPKTKSKSDEDKLKEAIRDIKVAHILKSNDIFESLKSEYDDFVPIYLNRIQYLEQQLLLNDSEKKMQTHEQIIELCQLGLEKINQNDLLRYFGEKTHDPALDESKKEFEAKRAWTIELLVNQGLACLESYALKTNSDDDDLTNASVFEGLKQIYVALQKWIDINDEKCAKFTVKFYMGLGLYGKALKVLFKLMEDSKLAQSSEQTILKVLNKMNLPHAHKYLENNLIMKYQKKYASY
jgi:hypothetical protein